MKISNLSLRPGRNLIRCGGLLLVVFLGSTAMQAEPAGESGANDKLIAKCTRLLTYGDTMSYIKPGKGDAAVALGLLGDEKAVPILVEHLLNEDNRELRMQIAKALGWIGSSKAVPALEEALRDKYVFVRVQAAAALKAITGKDYSYDRTGMPDPAKMREMMRASAEAIDAASNRAPEAKPATH